MSIGARWMVVSVKAILNSALMHTWLFLFCEVKRGFVRMLLAMRRALTLTRFSGRSISGIYTPQMSSTKCFCVNVFKSL